MIIKSLKNPKVIGAFLVKILVVCVVLSVSIMIFHVTLKYYDTQFWGGYLINKKEVYYGVFRYGFFAHISTAPLLILLALSQIFIIPISYKKLHRFLGKVYISLTLFVAAPGGMILSFYAFGGWVAKMSFFLLSILWFYYTFIGFIHIRKARISEHKLCMNRSFILLCSAVILRILSFITSEQFGLHGPNIYTINAILSWLIPFLLFEVIHRLKLK